MKSVKKLKSTIPSHGEKNVALIAEYSWFILRRFFFLISLSTCSDGEETDLIFIY